MEKKVEKSDKKAEKAETQILQNLLQEQLPTKDKEKENDQDKGNLSRFKPFNPEDMEPNMVHPEAQWQEDGNLFSEIMQEVVVNTTPDPNWNSQIPQGQADNIEPNDLDQLARIQVTTDVASLRRHLKKNLNTWATIMLILSNSVVHVEATQTPNISEPEMLKERETFKPVEMNNGPLFGTTSHPALTEVQKGNFTITLETFNKNPYLKTSIETQSQSYQINTQIIDISDLAISNHNALKFLNSHNQHQAYKKQLGFKSKPPSKDTLYKGGKDLYTQSMYEYALYPEKVGFSDCGLICPIMDSSLPASPQQLSEAAEIHNITQKDRMWIKTTQNATKRPTWSWEHIYDYEISWHNEQIYPNKGQEGIFMPFRMKTECHAFKDGIQVEHEKIGYIYQYYSDDGSYHKTEPYRLETAISPNWDCTVSVPNSDISYSHFKDDNICICVRPKTNNILENNRIEASNIQHSLSKLANNTPIETWRIRTNSPTSDLEEVDNMIKPRYIKEDKEQATIIKEGYLSESDLTTLRFRSPRSRALKKRDIFSGLLKILVSNPTLMTNLHKKVQEQLHANPQLQTIPTARVIGAEQTFADNLNVIFPRFKIQRKGNIIEVKDKHKKLPNWNTLDKSTTDLQAAEGIRQARRSNVNMKILKEKVVPSMLSNMVIPRSDLAKTKVAMDADTITQATYYGTYISIKTFIPTILSKTTRVYQIASLPHDHNKKTGKYITKHLNERIVMTPGSSDKPHNISSRCQQELIKNSGTLKHCQNKETTYQEINKLMSIGSEWSIYLIKNIGEMTISCPRSKLLWFNLDKNINIFIINNRCFTQGPGNLQITPDNENPTQDDISAICLMSYNLEDWIPGTWERWITQIVTVSVLALITCILVGCIGFLCWKKPWYCRVLTKQPDKKEQLSTMLKKRLTAIENKEKITSKDSGLEDHFEEVHIPMNRVPRELEDGEYLSYQRDYDKDLIDYNDGRADQIEHWYSTIKRKPKKVADKAMNMNTTDQNMEPEGEGVDEDKRNTAVHWRFDSNPLVARSNK